MKIDWKIENHILLNATQVPSSNFDARPLGASDISLLVIHNISLPPGVFGGPYVENLFLNRLDPKAHPFFETIFQRKFSSHLFIRRDGQVIQFVSFDQRAWHAGVSEFNGRPICNDYSIGIEVEGTDDLPFEAPQYDSLQKCTMALMQSYPAILQDRIVGHQDIAPDRKTDPGPHFDWIRFRSILTVSKG